MSYLGKDDHKLVPRNGHTLAVIIVARISGCADQKDLSLDDQVDHGKQEVSERFTGEVYHRVVQTKAKGERLDRPELIEVEQLIKTGEYDLLIVEDLGRLVRGTAAKDLFGLAVDHGMRCLSLNDGIDTADDNWEEDVIAACRDHVGHQTHTSKRIKHKAMNRFKRYGGAVPLPIAGYIGPPGSKTFGNWQIDPDATPIIREGLRRLQKGDSWQGVAEYFNEATYKESTGFPVGRYCRRPKWDGSMVRRFFANRLLGGAPGRGFRYTVKRHGTGRRISILNPKGPIYFECPHLAHVPLQELDDLLVMLKSKHQNLGCKGHSRGRSSRYPAGVATCWYCGRAMVWGANGMANGLMCPGSRERKCWCSVGFKGHIATKVAIEAIERALSDLQSFDSQFRGLVRRAAEVGGDVQQRRAKLRQEELTLARKQENLKATMAEAGPTKLVLDAIRALEQEAARLAVERRDIERVTTQPLRLPESVEALRELFRSECERLAKDSKQFHRLLGQLVSGLQVYLVQLLDGGHPLPRAKLTVRLDALAIDAARAEGLPQLLVRETTVDLFAPPEREQIRCAAAQFEAMGLGQRQIAERLKVSQAAVQKALALHRRMLGAGLNSPYRLLAEPPENYPKLRRHKHPKYRFEPLQGYERPTI